MESGFLSLSRAQWAALRGIMNSRTAGESKPFAFRVSEELAGNRLDRALAREVPGLSVRGAKALTDLGRVFVDQRRVLKASRSVKDGEQVEVYRDRCPSPPELRRGDLLWIGNSLVAVDKPPGLPVYGTEGVGAGTVVPQLERVLRESGHWEHGDHLLLVHRLDRDTSGILLVARNAGAARFLEEQFRRRRVEKRYLALVLGNPARADFRACSPVRARRHPGGLREASMPERRGVLGRMLPDRSVHGLVEARRHERREAGTRLSAPGAALPGKGRTTRPAKGQSGREGPVGQARGVPGEPEVVTEFRLLETLAGCALVEARPASGHTHQIRVHLAQLGHPVLGDTLYGLQRLEDPVLRAVPRQMLHAAVLDFPDPETGVRRRLEAPVAQDLLAVLHKLRQQKIS